MAVPEAIISVGGAGEMPVLCVLMMCGLGVVEEGGGLKGTGARGGWWVEGVQGSGWDRGGGVSMCLASEASRRRG